jgi:hypothetical protein
MAETRILPAKYKYYKSPPPRIARVCAMCYENNMAVGQGKNDKQYCEVGNHTWRRNNLIVTVPEYQLIRRPKHGRKSLVMCKNRLCLGYCVNAHSDAELKVWKWLSKNKGRH